MAKHRLDIRKADNDFLVWGISCQEDQYRALTALNDALGLDMELSEYFPLEWKGGQVFRFSLYHQADEDLGIEYFFVPNRSNYPEEPTHRNLDLFADAGVEETIRLIRELPQTDYFLIMKGDSVESYRHRTSELLGKASAFTAVQQVEAASLPSGRNLTF